MYSQCPECLTQFRVSAAALRAAHGTVRCGRCGSAFDALPHLTDTLTLDPGEHPAPLPTMPLALGGERDRDDAAALDDDQRGPRDEDLDAPDDGTLITEFHFSPDDIEQVFIDARDWQGRFDESGQAAPGKDASDGMDGEESSEEVPGAGAGVRSLGHARRRNRPSPAPGGSTPEVWVHEPEAVEDITLEGERIVIEGGPPEESTEHDDGSDGHAADLTDPGRRDNALHDDGHTSLAEEEFAAQLEEALRLQAIADTARSSATFPDRASRQESVAPSIVAKSATAEPVARAPVASIATPPAAAAAAAAATRRARRLVSNTAADPDGWPLEGDDEDAGVSSRRRAAALLWGVGALVLALALAAQLAHHYRQQLARDTNMGPLVRSAYHRLGLPLAENWNLDAFEMRQWGADAASTPAPDGRMTVRASLRNGANFAQPMPLLRLELEDRFGATIARRDFEPREYLKDPAQATRMLAAGASTEAELAVVDAARDAVGYRLDVCLRDETGAVNCSQSEPTATGAP
jgi:predicted Zn finger-like uncharacterized protein